MSGDCAKLRELAEKATPGPWEVGDGCVQSVHDNHPLVTIGQCNEDEVFIAAANPATIQEAIAAHLESLAGGYKSATPAKALKDAAWEVRNRAWPPVTAPLDAVDGGR